MANPFQQRSRQRKIIYLVLIVALFTASIMHRKFVVEKQAEDLQLREAVRGEVELTSSFVRLSLTGSRGLATTILWATAIDRMAKHEWNELELLVGSISKLQPYFITPWVFQSWNLAFNVAVECDRPRDKYYYVSRGLEFLAEGERRNQGSAAETVGKAGQAQFPGQPEMRHYMGFYYQLKIGNSDEKNTMRCLLDMSCIDPIQRNPERFWDKDARGQQVVKREELARLCENHPRLVRRLREGLGYVAPTQIVKFLEANKDVPSRFKKSVSSDQKDSDLEEPRKQFPILPPVDVPRSSGPNGPAWPNPRDYQMTAESMDVFLISRTWYQYAQEPLPPPLMHPGVTFEENKHIQELERLRKEKNVNYRNPKAMAIQIFRGYPTRAQIYIAENLEAEGWFDDDGWAIKGWFDQGDEEKELQVGTETKHHAGPSWEEAYRMCREYGTRTGLYMSPAELVELERKATQLRVALHIREGDPIPYRPDMRDKLGENFDAHQKLFSNVSLRAMTNFDATLAVAEGEKDRETVLARKALYQAARYKQDQIEAIPLFEQAWPLWVDVTLRYPQFMQNNIVQEDIYDPMLKYMRLVQRQNQDLFRAVNLAMAQMAIAPHPNWPHPSGWSWPDWPYWDLPRAEGRPYFADPAWKSRNSLRAARGPLEMVAYYDGPQARQVRNFWAGLTATASQLGQLGGGLPVLLPDYALAGGLVERRDPAPAGWRYLMDAEVVLSVRERYGLMVRERPTAPGMPPGPGAAPVPKALQK